MLRINQPDLHSLFANADLWSFTKESIDEGMKYWFLLSPLCITSLSGGHYSVECDKLIMN